MTYPYPGKIKVTVSGVTIEMTVHDDDGDAMLSSQHFGEDLAALITDAWARLKENTTP